MHLLLFIRSPCLLSYYNSAFFPSIVHSGRASDVYELCITVQKDVKINLFFFLKASSEVFKL